MIFVAWHQFVRDEILGGRDLLSVMFCCNTVQNLPFFQQINDVIPQWDAGCANLKDDAWFLSSHLLSMVRIQCLWFLLTPLTNKKLKHRAMT